MSVIGFQDAVPALDLYGSLERAAGLGMWRYTYATRGFVWSEGLRALLGLDGLEPASFSLFESFVHPDDRPRGGGLELFLRGHQVMDDEFRIIRRNGSLRWVSHRGQVFYDSDQRPVFAAGFLKDVTNRIEALSAANAAEARVQSLVQATFCFVWSTKPDGTTDVPDDWEALTGQTKQESFGPGWLESLHEADRERTQRAWLRSIETKSSYAAKYRLKCKDGVLRWFIARSEPIFDERGNLIEWFGVAFDISDIKSIDETFFSGLEYTGPSGALIRCARALLDWSISDLAQESGVSVSSIRRLETADGSGARDTTADRLTRALIAAGIEFCELDDKGVFVRLRKPRPSIVTGPAA